MKFRINKKTQRLLFVVAAVLLLTGCGRITGEDGKVLADKIIYLTTPFSHMINNEGWFEALFVWPFAQLINFLAQYMNVAIAVIVVTIFSRIVILPLSIKSAVQTQKMQVIQPQLQKIQDKYAGKTDDQSKMAMSQEMMNLYQKYDINPLGTIGGTFLNFPIMIAIWQAVQRASSVIEGSFLGLVMNDSPLSIITSDLIGSGWKYIILIVLLAITQFVSVKLPTYLARKNMKERDRKKAAAANDQTEMMMNMTLVMIVVMSVSMPTAMSFYWIVSALVQCIQTIFIQKRYVENERV